MKVYFFSLLFLSLSFTLQASIRLPNILGSDMVLPQKSVTKFWGWASPSEKIRITTSWDNKTIETSADGNANWQIELHTPSAGGPYTITLQGKNKIILENILIGEVWVCGGQSNMEWDYNRGILGVKEDFDKLGKLNMRFFNVPKITSKTPQDDCTGSWITCDSNTVKSFSAVGYYFGKYINQGLNVPIGLISSNWGGTPAEVWTPQQLIDSNVVLRDAAAKNKPTAWWPVAPGYAYNTMIAPLINYNIAGAIWYQGESNTSTWQTYSQLMETMIMGWRKVWHNDFPFYYVQIAPYHYDSPFVGALLREAQGRNILIPKTGMVVISDLVNDTLDIHPKNKKDVGLRLANLALVETYGKKIEDYKSPVFKALTIKGNKAEVELNFAENGLFVKGKKAEGFFIAGSDKVFYPGNIKLKGNKIVVSNEKVKAPVSVRYQFSNAGVGNLFNKSGLPVASFRTDNWDTDVSKIKM